jgi:hypothetical protein
VTDRHDQDPCGRPTLEQVVGEHQLMAGTVVLTVLGEGGGGGVDQGLELVGVLADLRGQGAHRIQEPRPPPFGGIRRP